MHNIRYNMAELSTVGACRDRDGQLTNTIKARQCV